MGQKMKSISLAAIMLLSTLSGIMMAAPAAATQVVITEAIQVVDGGVHPTACQRLLQTLKETFTLFGVAPISTCITQ